MGVGNAQSQVCSLLGGNIKLERGHQHAHCELKMTCKKLKGSLYRPEPNHPVAQHVIRGVALNRRVFKEQVNVPPRGHINSTVSALSGLIKTEYHIPQKAPPFVAYEVPQIPNPEYQLRAVILEGMYKLLNSNKHVVADVTLYELQRPKRGGNRDYSKAMQWLSEKEVYIRAVIHYHAATSMVRLTHNPRHSLVLYLFTNANEQKWWRGGDTYCWRRRGKSWLKGVCAFPRCV